MKDFNIAKYLKENNLGPHAILGAYVDLHGLKEETQLNEASLELDWDYGLKYLKAQCKKHNLNFKVIEENLAEGLYVKISGKKNDIIEFLKDGYVQDEEDLEFYSDSLKEQPEMELDTEIPYEGPEHKLDGFGDEFVQDSPVEEKAGKDDRDSLMTKLFAIQKRFGWKKVSQDTEPFQNIRISNGMKRVRNNYVEDGSITVDIDSTVSRAAFTEIKNLLQTKFPDWKIDPSSVKKDYDPDTDSKNVLFFDIVKNKSVKEDSPVEEIDSMDYDDSVNPFPSLMPDEQGKFDRMMGLIDQNIEPRLGQIKSIIDGSREQGYADRTIFTVLARHPLVRNSIEALVDDGFEFQDIIDFFATDFSQNEEIAGYKAGVQMEGAEEYIVDFGTNTMTYTLDRANSVLRGLKPGIVPGADREEDIIPVTISPEGYLSTTDRSVKDISPKSNKNPFSDPSYRNID
jgi:hypothetical protein